MDQPSANEWSKNMLNNILSPSIGILFGSSFPETSTNRAIFSRPGPQMIRHTNFLEEKGVLSDALRRSFSKILRERLAEHVKKGV